MTGIRKRVRWPAVVSEPVNIKTDAARQRKGERVGTHRVDDRHFVRSMSRPRPHEHGAMPDELQERDH